MAYRERLLQLEESAAFSDWDEGELAIDDTAEYAQVRNVPSWGRL